MALELDPDWPGLDEDKTGNYTNRTEIKRIAGEVSELVKKLTTSSGNAVTEFVTAPGSKPPEPQLPAGAGSLPDLQRYCALSQNQMGEWPTAMQFGLTVNFAYSRLIGEQGSTSGLYAGLVLQAEKTIEALYDTTKVSQGAEHASEEAAARQET
ncbi:MAG: hypothetical protein HOV96_23585 [Nonomuraea sp.]|nr:hypothetical protein [Nonomuraea sp.]NUP64257.1 hypothetical protein [Nonomuraea sp.]NUP80530.1 hypothetical protein [Nonomuraea sp.]NUS08262.1 hypothetical protein [Nonomuraea sp.]NUT09257.1 hypothetical protein [Nonomuraea sp.]